MGERVLVTYATHTGSTAEVASVIADVLASEGTAVDVRPAGSVEGIAGYQAVVVGSPLHSGQWLPEAVSFVNTHRTALCRIPVAFFILCMLPHDTAEDRRAKAAAVDTLRVMLKPVALGVFAGAMDYGKLSAIQRLQVQTKGLPEGDFRDWEAIRAWAAGLRPALLADSRQRLASTRQP